MLTTIQGGLRANSREIDAISNNIANLNTTGFKKKKLTFEDVYRNSASEKAGAYRGAGVLTGIVTMSAKQGEIQKTDMVLDLAIEGEGLFVLSGNESDNITFSRAGSFELNKENRIVDADGNSVNFFLPTASADGSGGKEISNILGPLEIPVFKEVDGISYRLRELEIDIAGRVLASYGDTSQDLMGQLALAKFNSPSYLKSIGSTAFIATEDSGAPIISLPAQGSLGKINSGSLERSNVDVTNELVAMIKAQQAYNGNARLMQTDIEIARTLIQG
tara:strand:- start:32 stop:859 length:828 start_codon:yes stop_codon:yes gene_type:complete